MRIIAISKGHYGRLVEGDHYVWDTADIAAGWQFIRDGEVHGDGVEWSLVRLDCGL